MRYIDAFNHFNPKRYFDELLLSPSGQKDIGKRVRGIPALYDLDLRKKVVEQFPDYTQVLSLGLPMIERLWGPDKSPEMAKIANDGLAEVVAKNPDHFVGYSATLPMNNPDAAAKEAERALKNGANAVQIGTNANGGPIDGKEFWPIYEVIEKSGKPILLHPARSREMIDYAGEAKSKYEICSVLGWPFETGVALSRGLTLAAGNRSLNGAKFNRCERDGCYVEMLIDNPTVTALGGAGKSTSISVVAYGKTDPFQLPVSLNGFTDALERMKGLSRERAVALPAGTPTPTPVAPSSPPHRPCTTAPSRRCRRLRPISRCTTSRWPSRASAKCAHSA